MHHCDCLPQPKQWCPSIQPAHGFIHPFCILCSYSYSGAQLCPTLCIVVVNVELLSRVWLFWDLVDCGPPGSSAHGMLQARILEWVAIILWVPEKSSSLFLIHCLILASLAHTGSLPSILFSVAGWGYSISHPLAGFLFPALHSSMLAFTLHLHVLPIMQIRSSQPHSLKHFSTSLTSPFLSPKGKVCAPSNGPKDPASSGP